MNNTMGFSLVAYAAVYLTTNVSQVGVWGGCAEGEQTTYLQKYEGCIVELQEWKTRRCHKALNGYRCL